MPEEQGEIRNSNITRGNEPDFNSKNITPDATSPRLENKTPGISNSQVATAASNQGKPLFFCVNNSANGDMIDV